jgi:hypothetical protein
MPAGLELGLGLRLGLADATADRPAVAMALGAADMPTDGLAEPLVQPEMTTATIPLTSSRFVARKGNLFM